MRRILLTGLGIVILLLVAGLAIGGLWIKSLIHSDAFRHELETRAGDQLHGTVEIQQIDWNSWNAFTLDGLATKFVTEQGTIVTQVESVRCDYSLTALLKQRVYLHGLTITKPHITLTQEPPPSVTTPPPPAPVKPDTATPAEAQSGNTAPIHFMMEVAKVIDGEITIKDTNGADKADLQGVQVTTDAGGYFIGKDATGNLSIATIALPQNISFTDFSTPFTFRDGAYSASGIKGNAFSGQFTGAYKLEPGAASLLAINATNIDMAQVGQAAKPGAPTRLSGTLALQSTWNAVETGKLTGQGAAQIVNAKLMGDPLINELADAFRVPEMHDPDLSSIVVLFQVANGSTHFNNLKILSASFEMSGSGDIDPQGNLAADMLLTLHADAYAKIPPIAKTAFTQLPDGGGSIPFTLSGTTDHPQADSLTKAFISGSKVQQAIKNTLDKLFK
jgi:hypothetical protein